MELNRRGYSCWYDNRMTNLTKQGMSDGVRSSAVFVLFLSKGVPRRPFVRFEVGEALKHAKQMSSRARRAPAPCRRSPQTTGLVRSKNQGAPEDKVALLLC